MAQSKSKKATTVVEFSLLIVVTILAFITMQSMIKRGVQGNLRSSANRLGAQFSPRWTNETKIYNVYSNSDERIKFGKKTTTTKKDALIKESSQVAAPRTESAELKQYF